MRPDASWNTTRDPRSTRARQVWLKMDEQGSEIGRGDREGIGREGEGMDEGVYIICEGRRLRWRELARLEEGKTAEVLVELKGGAGKKRAKKSSNPWNTPSSESEPERVLSENGTKKIQEELEKKVAQAMEEGGVLNQLADVLAVMVEKERGEMMRRYEAGMPEELGQMYVVAGRTTIEKMMGERVREEWRRRERRISSKKESRGGIFRRRVDQKMSLTGVWVLGIEIYRCVHDSRVIFEIGVGIGVAFSFSWDRCFSIKSFGGFFF